MNPAQYNLLINSIYFVLNIGCAALLIYAWRCSKFRDVAMGLFALAISFSIITSGCNALVGVLRALGMGLESKKVILWALERFRHAGSFRWLSS